MLFKSKSNKECIKEIGNVVDMPFEEFKEELVKQQVNIGTMNNLILYLSSLYHELNSRKEAVLHLVFTGSNTKDEVLPVLNGLYAEMTKLEQKIVYLKETSKKLLDLGNTTS